MFAVKSSLSSSSSSLPDTDNTSHKPSFADDILNLPKTILHDTLGAADNFIKSDLNVGKKIAVDTIKTGLKLEILKTVIEGIHKFNELTDGSSSDDDDTSDNNNNVNDGGSGYYNIGDEIKKETKKQLDLVKKALEILGPAMPMPKLPPNDDLPQRLPPPAIPFKSISMTNQTVTNNDSTITEDAVKTSDSDTKK